MSSKQSNQPINQSINQSNGAEIIRAAISPSINGAANNKRSGQSEQSIKLSCRS
jgi:hypothetical protein